MRTTFSPGGTSQLIEGWTDAKVRALTHWVRIDHRWAGPSSGHPPPQMKQRQDRSRSDGTERQADYMAAKFPGSIGEVVRSGMRRPSPEPASRPGGCLARCRASPVEGSAGADAAARGGRQTPPTRRTAGGADGAGSRSFSSSRRRFWAVAALWESGKNCPVPERGRDARLSGSGWGTRSGSTHARRWARCAHSRGGLARPDPGLVAPCERWRRWRGPLPEPPDRSRRRIPIGSSAMTKTFEGRLEAMGADRAAAAGMACGPVRRRSNMDPGRPGARRGAAASLDRSSWAETISSKSEWLPGGPGAAQLCPRQKVMGEQSDLSRGPPRGVHRLHAHRVAPALAAFPRFAAGTRASAMGGLQVDSGWQQRYGPPRVPYFPGAFSDSLALAGYGAAVT